MIGDDFRDAMLVAKKERSRYVERIGELRSQCMKKRGNRGVKGSGVLHSDSGQRGCWHAVRSPGVRGFEKGVSRQVLRVSVRLGQHLLLRREQERLDEGSLCFHQFSSSQQCSGIPQFGEGESAGKSRRGPRQLSEY